MARKKKQMGVCRICNTRGALSVEHVPPQAAYNKETVVEYSWQDTPTRRKVKGRSIQGGVGQFTLCETCNNNTGDWYGREYVKWARVCQDVIIRWRQKGITQDKVTLSNVYPLRFLKQVVTCFFSVVGAPGSGVFANNNPELVQFVLDKQKNSLAEGFRFFLNLYAYSSPSTALRRFPLAGKITIQHDAGFKAITPLFADSFSEIAHPPFQLVMTQDGEIFHNATEITEFASFGYYDRVNQEIELRIVSSASPYPGAG
jgi:hypothetical protein